MERSGIFEAVDGHVLIYIHKEAELDDVEWRYPAAHYVLVDDKPRILAAVKNAWGDRVTTVFPRQGQFAHAPDAASYRAADLAVERIGDLLEYDPTSKILYAGPPYVLECDCSSRADAAHRLVSSLIRPQSRMIFERIAGPLLKQTSPPVPSTIRAVSERTESSEGFPNRL